VRIACEFLVRSDQIQDFDAVSQLVRAAAQRVAAAEDLVLAFGRRLVGKDPPLKKFNPWNDADLQGRGLSDFPLDGSIPGNLGEDPIEAVRKGITTLQTEGHTGPYAVLMLPKLWEEASESGGESADQRKTIKTLIGEGGSSLLVPAPVNPSPPAGSALEHNIMRRGIVVALTPGAFDLVVVDAPHVAMVSQQGGDLVMRVEERLVLRFMDASATTDIAIEDDTVRRARRESDPWGDEGGGPGGRGSRARGGRGK
jgi:uncharacterized linocin/CFP29 family protein